MANDPFETETRRPKGSAGGGLFAGGWPKVKQKRAFPDG